MKHLNTIYAILDTKTNDYMGNAFALSIHKHQAAAVRFFSDVFHSPHSPLAAHPEDYTLVQLGYLDLDNQLVPEYMVILEAQSIAAMENTHA